MPTQRSTFDGGLRPFANRLFQAGIGEWSLVLLLGAAWISPRCVETVRPGFLAGLPLLFVAEFIFGHASAGMSVALKFEGVGRWLFALFLTLIYGIWFVLLFRMGSGIQAAFFLWITAGRLYRADAEFRQHGAGRGNRDKLAARLAIPALLRFFTLIACVFLSVVIPLPQLGLAGYSGPNAGSGSFVDHPETLVFVLMLHFASITWLERNVFPRVAQRFVF